MTRSAPSSSPSSQCVSACPTLAEFGAERLRAVCRALGFDALSEQSALDLFASMSATWGGKPIDQLPEWPSDITDDYTPFELSLAVTDVGHQLRFLVEAQGEVPSLQSNWDAACALNRRLAADYGVPLGRLRAVEDLFEPTSEMRRFSMWHAVCLEPHATPDFKVYLNPQASGRDLARATVEEAMGRLGLSDSRAFLPELGNDDSFVYFSLDLSAKAGARVKVYTAHHYATMERIEAALRPARSYTPGLAADLCVAMSGFDGPYCLRPVLTCLSFVEGNARPTMGTLHFPVRSYASDDRVIRERVLAYIQSPGSGAATYQRALDAFADRRLEDGIGMQTYVSLRMEQPKRITVYLAPEVFEVGQIALTDPQVSGVRLAHWLDGDDQITNPARTA